VDRHARVHPGCRPGRAALPRRPARAHRGRGRLRSGRYYGVGSAEQARRGAEDFIARTAGTTLAAPTVEAVISDDGATMQVTVSGTVLAVVPGLELRVAKQAIGAIEQVTR
jgi:hypothetical protein